MLNLKSPIGTNYRIEPNDLMNTKRALNQLGYYDIPPHRGIDDWTDDAMFDGVRRFQKDNGLKVDGLMRPERPTETVINRRLQSKMAFTPQRISIDAMTPGACSCKEWDDQPYLR